MTAEKHNVQCFTQLYKNAKLQESPFRPVERSLIKTSYCIAVIMQKADITPVWVHAEINVRAEEQRVECFHHRIGMQMS